MHPGRRSNISRRLGEMSANTGKAARPDRAGRKVASGLAGVGSAAAIVGAGVAAALHGQPIAPEQDAGVQQAALTATVSPIPTPASSPSTPIVGPGTPTNNAFGFSGQVGVNLPQAFPSLFGTGQAGFNPGGVSTILNVSPPTDSRIAGFLPLNNVQNVFGSL